MKKFALVFVMVFVIFVSNVTFAEEVEIIDPTVRDAFSSSLWKYTSDIGEGQGELTEYAFGKGIQMMYFDYTDGSPIANQKLIILMGDQLYTFNSFDDLTVELCESLSTLYEDEQVPSDLFYNFELDEFAPYNIYEHFTKKFNCTVLLYELPQE